MSDTKDDSVSYEVKFVIPKGKTSAEVSEIMKTAFEAMDCNCLEPMWITQEECLQFKEKQSKLFIFDPFGDDAFQHLSSLKCRILGPLCILSCLQNGQSLPLKPYPVYSVTMRGITVTCSNINKTAREEIAEKTRLMGGLFNKDLTQSVTHLIVDSVGSAKYHVANHIGLPIMLPEWINDCWNNGQYEQLHANDSSYNRYRCPIFKGLCITVSQLSNEERKNVRCAIEQNGGRYSGQMRANVTTHLVLLQPKGDKYKFGKTWKVKCVKLSWLYESLEAGYAKEETQYQLDNTCESAIDTSTPEKDSNLPILGQLGNCSSNPEISMIPYRESRIDETTNSDTTFIPVTTAADFPSFCPLDELSDITHGGQFLDGCRIFINGFSGTRLDKLRKIINAGCGTRFNKMGENITHIILGEKDEDIIKYASECSTEPHVVSYLWLLNCYKERKLLDEEPYQYNVNNNCPQALASKNNSITHVKKHSTLQTCEENENNADVSNHLNNAVSHYISLDENMNPDKIPSLDIVAPHIAFKPHSTPERGSTTNEGNLLFGFTIIINGFGPKDTELIEQLVKSENGKVVTGSVADFCIVPVTGSDLTAAPTTNILTNCWLQMCIEQETLLPFDSNPLFKPLSIKPGSLILKDCVLSFSQYIGTERDCLTHLAEEMGAHCQEYFVRKANKSRKLLPNTHLVVAVPEGNKYEAAKKWNIPAVTKDWLLASVYKGLKAIEEEYLVDFQPSMTKDSVCTAIQMADVTNLSENDVSNKETCNAKIHTPTNNERNLPINGTTNKFIRGVKSQADAARCGSESTPSKFLNPDISFHPDYEVNSLLSMLNNSNTIGGHSRKESLPMQDLFASNISKALKNIGVEQNSSGDSDCQEHAISDLHKDSLKENIRPLKNVVVCVSKKLVGKQSEFHNIITSLGGECQWNYSSSCTHFVCQGKTGATSREIKLAQDEGKKVVSPEWIYACQDALAHVDEMLYPFTYNPRLSLLGQISSKKVNNVVLPEKLNDSECVTVDQSLSKTSNLSKCQSPIVENENEKKNENVKTGVISKELEAVLNVSKTKSEKSIATSRNSKSSAHVFENKFGAECGTEKNLKPEEPSAKIQPPLPETEVQSLPIVWDDPTGRSERELLAECVSKEDELNADSPEKQVKCSEYPVERNVEIMPISDCHNEAIKVANVTVDFREPETKKKTTEVIHKFMFSGLSDNEKDHYASIIKTLGGKVSTVKSFDLKATHLILGQPLKNEKFLSSVASGLWVLHKTYVEACAKAGHFIDESCHEWGGPMTYRLENSLPDKLSKVAMCPSRWRTKIQEKYKTSGNKKCGAFQGWKVLIIAEKQKQITYSQILESGGAEIISSPFNPHSIRITHAFIEVKSQIELSNINLESLVSAGISCLKPEYLAFYLIEPVVPPEEKFFIPEAQELIEKFSTEKKRKCSEESIGTAKRHHQCNK